MPIGDDNTGGDKGKQFPIIEINSHDKQYQKVGNQYPRDYT